MIKGKLTKAERETKRKPKEKEILICDNCEKEIEEGDCNYIKTKFFTVCSGCHDTMIEEQILEEREKDL